ncbi:hypothetical protein ACQP2P_20025 [Dactylosporangium sp. CA-139114]|uniref:hypothetical protein n=1 Tax=Dactylosporangium sp. CA-139114 TaxID=3239931 RepID=UPI003D989AED
MTVYQIERQLTSAQRERLAALADVLITAGAGLPSASQAKVHEKWVDRALSARPDLFDGLVAALEGDDDPALAVDRLKKSQPALFDTLSFVVAGSYLMNPAVTKALGMPGNAPKPMPALPDEADHYLSGGILDPVIARGPIYRPTPDAQPKA